MRKDHYVRVRAEPGATSEDMIDLILPKARQRPDLICLHVGTNDLTKKSNKNPDIPKERRPVINTVENMKTIFNIIRKEAPSTKIAYSLILPRFDRPELKGRINDTNNRMTNLCAQFGVDCITHSNFEKSCLTKSEREGGKKGGGLHPIPKGNGVLAKNVMAFMA